MRRTVRAGLAVTAVVVLALLAAEATMQPSAQDRAVLMGVFAAVAALVAVAAGILSRLTSRLASLHAAVLVTAIGAVAAAAAAILASAASMFISTHDLRLVLVALGLGVALGIVLATAVTDPLAADLRAIRETAEAVARGQRTARTGVDRADEVGELARALDDMIDRLAASEVEQARMEAARRDFLAAVGHDLRTPLTSLRAALEALQDGMVADVPRYYAAMQADVTLLGSLVDDLFLLGTIESGGLRLEREAADLAELADESVEALRPLAERHDVELRVVPDGPVPVTVSAREIGRVLRNLVDNAIRHSPVGGTVTVTVSSDGKDACLSVVDDGAGFDRGWVERAFESFTRHDSARRRDGAGAGLGLAIARGLIDAHGGSIAARPGPGGRVDVRLPLRGVRATLQRGA